MLSCCLQVYQEFIFLLCGFKHVESPFSCIQHSVPRKQTFQQHSEKHESAGKLEREFSFLFFVSQFSKILEHGKITIQCLQFDSTLEHNWFGLYRDRNFVSLVPSHLPNYLKNSSNGKEKLALNKFILENERREIATSTPE